MLKHKKEKNIVMALLEVIKRKTNQVMNIGEEIQNLIVDQEELTSFKSFEAKVLTQVD